MENVTVNKSTMNLRQALDNPDISLTRILSDAFHLAEIRDDSEFACLFSHHLNGLADEEAAKNFLNNYPRAYSMFFEDRRNRDSKTSNTSSINVVELGVRDYDRDIQQKLEEVSALRHVEALNPLMKNKSNFSSGVISYMRTYRSGLADILVRVRNRVSIYLHSVERSLNEEAHDMRKKRFRDDIQRRRDERNQYLLNVFTASEGNAERQISLSDIAASLALDEESSNMIARFWHEKGILHLITFGTIWIPAAKLEEVERMVEETYKERAQRTLKAIYELAGRKPGEWVIISSLQTHLEMSVDYLYPVLNDLEERLGYIGSVDEAVWIKPAGVEALENPTPSNSGSAINIINNQFHSSVGGVQQQTYQSEQNIVQTINPELERTLDGLLRVVDQSNASAYDKEEIRQEIGRLSALAQQPSETWATRASARLKMLETLISAAGLIKAAEPYLPQIIHFFQRTG